MSTGDTVFILSVIAMFVVFAGVVVWGDTTTRVAREGKR